MASSTSEAPGKLLNVASFADDLAPSGKEELRGKLLTASGSDTGLSVSGLKCSKIYFLCSYTLILSYFSNVFDVAICIVFFLSLLDKEVNEDDWREVVNPETHSSSSHRCFWYY